MKKNIKKKGFTLIELIVVIAILGILAAIAVPKLTGFREKAQIKADIASARTIIGAANAAVADGATINVGDDLSTTGLGNYLNSWPVAQYGSATLTLAKSGTEWIVTNGASTSPVQIAPVPASPYDIP